MNKWLYPVFLVPFFSGILFIGFLPEINNPIEKKLTSPTEQLKEFSTYPEIFWKADSLKNNLSWGEKKVVSKSKAPRVSILNSLKIHGVISGKAIQITGESGIEILKVGERWQGWKLISAEGNEIRFSNGFKVEKLKW